MSSSSEIIAGLSAAARYVGVSYSLFKKYVDEIGIPYKVVGHTYLFRRADLNRWKESGWDKTNPVDNIVGATQCFSISCQPGASNDNQHV